MNSRQIIGFAVGPIGAAILGVLTVPLLAWFFAAEDIGKLAMLQVATSFVLVVFSLGLDQVFVREYHESNNKPLLIKSSFLPGVAVLLIALSVFFFIEDGYLSEVVFSISSVSWSILLSIVFVSALLGRFLSLILRMEEKGLLFSISQLLPKFIFPLIIFCAYAFSARFDLTMLIWAQALSIACVAVIYTFNTRRAWVPGLFQRLNLHQLAAMLGFGLPFVFGGLAFWLLQTADKILLRSVSSFHELGIYSVAVSVAASVGLLTTVFTTVWSPMVYRWISEGRDLSVINDVLKSALAVLALIVGVAGICSNTLSIFLPAVYVDVQYMVLPLMLGPLLYGLSEISAIGLGVSRKSIFSMIASALSAVFSMSISYSLIVRYDAVGASIGVAVSFWFFLVLRTELACVVWRQVKRAQMYVFSFSLVLIVSLYSFFGMKQYVEWVFVFVWFALIVLGGVLLNSEIRQLVGYVAAKVKQLFG